MIVDVDYGSGFRGILEYALNKPGAYLIGPTRGDADDLCQTYAHFRKLNEEALNPVVHLWISIHPDERLSDRAWESVAEEMMSRLGYREHFYVVARHTDTSHEHIHIIGCRIGANGRKHEVWREKRKANDIAAGLERKHGLKQAALRWGEKAGDRRRGRLRTHIDRAMRRSQTVSELVERLESVGVGVKANLSGSHVSGVSFWFEGRSIKGSALGRAYSWGKLTARLTYLPARDLPRLIQAAEKAQSLAAAWRGRPKRLGKPGQPWQWRGHDLLGLLGRLGRRTGKALSREIHKSGEEEEREREGRGRER